MKVQAVLLLALLSVAAAAAASQPLSSWTKPAFCKGQDCPKYEEVEKGDGYETRKYEEAWWAWVHYKGDDPMEAFMRAYAQLWAYFNGANEGEKSFPVGTPLASNISRSMRKGVDMVDALGRKKKREVEMTMKLYLPYKCVYSFFFQEGKEEPPKPSNEDVKVDKFPEWTAHVRGFSGFPTHHAFKQHAEALVDYLEEDNKEYSDDWGMFSIYDPPTELENRYNEVLFLAEASDRRGRKPCGYIA